MRSAGGLARSRSGMFGRHKGKSTDALSELALARVRLIVRPFLNVEGMPGRRVHASTRWG